MSCSFQNFRTSCSLSTKLRFVSTFLYKRIPPHGPLENAGGCCASQRCPIHKKASIPKQDEGSYAHQSTTYFTDQHLLFPNAETRRSLLLVQPAAQERSSRQATPRRLSPHPARLRFPLAVLSPSSHLHLDETYFSIAGLRFQILFAARMRHFTFRRFAAISPHASSRNAM